MEKESYNSFMNFTFTHDIIHKCSCGNFLVLREGLKYPNND